MKFKQIIRLLREGNKVFRPSWDEGSYWTLGQDEIIMWSDGKKATIHLNQIEAEDWEIYEETLFLEDRIKEFLKEIKENKLIDSVYIHKLARKYKLK